MLDAIFKPFAEQAPVCVMAVAAARRLLGKDRLDRLSERARFGQYVHQLMFSDLFDLMAAVVSGSRGSVHHACQTCRASASRRWRCTTSSRASSRRSARRWCGRRRRRVATVMAEMDATAGHAGRRAPVLPGYRTRVPDGTASRRPSTGSSRCGRRRPGRCRARAWSCPTPTGSSSPTRSPAPTATPRSGRSCARCTRRSPPATCGRRTGTSARPSSWPSWRPAGRAS